MRHGDKFVSSWRLALATFIIALPALIISSAGFSSRIETCEVILDVQTDQALIVQLHIDHGAGFSSTDSGSLRIVARASPQRLHFLIGKAAISRLMLETDRSGKLDILGISIVAANGHAVTTLDVQGFQPLSSATQVLYVAGVAHVTIAAGDMRRGLVFSMPQPFRYKASVADWLAYWPYAVGILCVSFLLTSGIYAVIRWLFVQSKDTFLVKRLIDRWGPSTLVILAGLLSLYPLFLGRSLTSPQINSVSLLYTAPPYLPGGSMEKPSFVRGSDLGAFAWQWQPWTQIQRKAIKQGQPPLWNRFDYGGLPEIGQGISQIGDFLHLIPLLGSSSAVSWDLQFGVMRILFALGCFWVVLRLTGVPWVAAAVGASSAFIGFFLFRINHAGYFVLCYTPFLFLGWIDVARATGRLQLVRGALLLCLASLGALNCGAIKEGFATLIIMHATGLIFLAQVPLTLREKLFRLAVTGLFGTAALCLQYPLAAGFMANLAQSHTESDIPLPETLPLLFLGSFFDDFLYFKIALQRFPTLNFALGLCILWAFIYVWRLAARPGFHPILFGMGLAALLIYGIVPEPLIAAIPLIGHIGHVDDAFLIPFIVLGICLAGFGLAAFVEDVQAGCWQKPFGISAGLLALITTIAIYAPIALSSDSRDPVMPVILAGLLLLTLLLPLFAIRFARAPARFLVSGAAAVAIIFTLHARQGLQLASGLWRIDHYLVMPGPRPDYLSPSPAVTFLRTQLAQMPARAIGTQANLFPGYGAALGIELINGADPLVPKNIFALVTAFDVPMDWGWRIHFENFAELHTFDALLDFLNVRWVVAPPDKTDGTGNLDKRLSADLAVYERPSAWPRAFFSDQIDHYANVADLVARIKRDNGSPFSAVAGATSTADPAGKPQIVPAHDYRLRPNGTDFRIDVPKPGMIVLAETCVSGVVATIDDKPVPVECVDSIYRGIRIGHAGHFEVSFDYKPGYWRMAPIALAGGIGFFTVACAFAFFGCKRLTSA